MSSHGKPCSLSSGHHRHVHLMTLFKNHIICLIPPGPSTLDVGFTCIQDPKQYIAKPFS